jgi:cell division protein FtsB
VNRISTIIILLLSVLMMCFTIAGNHGLLHLRRLNREVESLRKKNDELAQEVSSVRTELEAAQNSDVTLEKTAREQLGLAKPNEVVYIFPEAKAQAK